MYDETFDNGREGFDGEEAHATLSALLSFLCGGIPPTFEQRGGNASADDGGVYDLSTPQGREAWKANAPEGAVRTVVEDGEEWVEAVIEEVRAVVEAWAEPSIG